MKSAYLVDFCCVASYLCEAPGLFISKHLNSEYNTACSLLHFPKPQCHHHISIQCHLGLAARFPDKIEVAGVELRLTGLEHVIPTDSNAVEHAVCWIGCLSRCNPSATLKLEHIALTCMRCYKLCSGDSQIRHPTKSGPHSYDQYMIPSPMLCYAMPCHAMLSCEHKVPAETHRNPQQRSCISAMFWPGACEEQRARHG